MLVFRFRFAVFRKASKLRPISLPAQSKYANITNEKA